MGRSLSVDGFDRRGRQGLQAFEMFRFKCWPEYLGCFAILILAAHSLYGAKALSLDAALDADEERAA